MFRASGLSRSSIEKQKDNKKEDEEEEEDLDDDDQEEGELVIFEEDDEKEIKLNLIQIRSLILYDFKSGVRPSDSLKKIRLAFGENSVSKATVYNQYRKFRKGNFSLEDDERSGRPNKLNDEKLKELIKASPSIVVEELAEIMDVSVQTVRNHLHSLGYVRKSQKWVYRQK